MSGGQVDHARRLMDAWTRRDVEEALELLHEDVEWRPAITAGGLERVVYRGHAGIRSWFDAIDEVWTELRIEDADFRKAGENRVVQLGTFRAIGKESGVPVERPQAILFEFTQGKAIRVRGFESQGEALEAAGQAD
jgi:ketosteroid isomerase-like protein